MTQPSPEHPITVSPNPRRVRVTFGGAVVADSARALRLQEASYRPVLYIPRADADMGCFARTDHHTHCPYKGEASYYTLEVGGKQSIDAVWSYEQPFPAVSQIEGHLAFYPDRVDRIEEL